MNRKIYTIIMTLVLTFVMAISSLSLPTYAAECSYCCEKNCNNECENGTLVEGSTKDYKYARAGLHLAVKYPVVNDGLYLDKTYVFYDNSLDYGDYILNKINETSDEYTKTLCYINSTKENLLTCTSDNDKALNTAKLKFNILKTSQLKESDYTDYSWILLETALENAEEALDSSSTSGVLLANINALKGCVLRDMNKVNPMHVKDVFTDIKETAWYVPGVQFVYDYGFMSGNNGLFNPNADITRAQLVTTLYRMVGCPNTANRAALKDFSDIAEGKYYTDAVCWAYAEGITTGNNGKFDPTGKLTRQQMAAFFYRFSEYLELDTETRGDFDYMLKADQTYSYAKDPVAWAVGSGYISGSNVNVNGVAMKDLNPRGNTTRAQVATIIMRFCEVN